jgi:hypothetical protein
MVTKCLNVVASVNNVNVSDSHISINGVLSFVCAVTAASRSSTCSRFLQIFSGFASVLGHITVYILRKCSWHTVL